MRIFRLLNILFLAMLSIANLCSAQDGEHILHVKGLYSFWNNPQQVVLQEDYAYISTCRSGLQIIDVSDLANPFVACHFTEIGASDLEVEDSLVFTYQNRTFNMVDVSDPMAPELLYRRTDNYESNGQMSAGNGWVFYSLDEWDGGMSFYYMMMLDVSNPRNVGGGILEQSGYSVCLYNTEHLLFQEFGRWLYFLRLERGQHPRAIARYDWIRPRELSCVDDRLLVLGRQNFQIIDISDPENAELESELQLEDRWTVQFDNDLNTSIVATRDSTLHLIDIRDFDNPTLINSFESEHPIADIAIQDSICVALTADREFLIYDWDEEGVELLSSLNGRGQALDVKIDGENGYLCLGESGFRKMNISNPENPEEITTWDINALRCKIYDNFALVTTNDTLFFRINLDDPDSQPLELPIENRMFDFDYEDGLIYVALENPYRLSIYNSENMDNPVGEYQLPERSYPFSIEYESGIVYLGDIGRFRIIDVSDPENPHQVTEVLTRSSVPDFYIEGEYLYVADSQVLRSDEYFPSVWKYSMEDPVNPRFEGCYIMESCDVISEIQVRDDFLYIMGRSYNSTQRLEIVNIADPRRMMLLGWYSDQLGGGRFDITDDYVYVANVWNYDILDCSQSLRVELDQSESMEDFAVFEAYPNPFNSSVKIEFSLAYDQYVGGAILDVNGRQVADLGYSGIMQHGKNTLTWDADGYPSGIYLIKVNLNGGTKVNQIVLQK